MTMRRYTAVKWVLYSVVALLALLLQTSVVGSFRLLGAHFCLLPVAVACTAIREGRDNGALFGLCCGVFQTLSGAEYGAIYIITLTLAGALCGLLCDLWLRRSFVCALLLSFLSVLLTEGAVCGFLIAAGSVPMLAISSELLPTCLISLLFTPLFHACAGGISRTGGRYGT